MKHIQLMLLILTLFFVVSLTSCTGLQSNMVSVSKTVRLRLMGLGCFLPMGSLWYVPAYLSFFKNKKTQPCELSCNSFSLSPFSILSLMNQRCGSLIQKLQHCSPIKTRTTSQSTLFQRAFQMPRRSSGT